MRQAALKAGIGVIQFVHEPVAALHGYLRVQPDYRRVLDRLEGRSVLVFDWGDGTLDGTLCRIQGGSIMQIGSQGDNEVGGDEFDGRLRNLLREKHAAAHKLEDITGLEQPGMATELLNQCELVKIELSRSDADSQDIIVRNFLRVEGPAQNLVASVSKEELEGVSSTIVARGLGRIDEILEQTRLTNQDIELCLATGGMVNMPAIRNGLTERFIGRVPKLNNSDRIIAEGAAWIANDDLRLILAKPIEPVVELAKPVRTGPTLPTDPRKTLCVLNVPVDCRAAPLLEKGSNAASKSTMTMWLRPPCAGQVGAPKPRLSFMTWISASPCRRMANQEGDEERTVTSLMGEAQSYTHPRHDQTSRNALMLRSR